MSLDEIEVIKVKYPPYLRKTQRMKLKVNDTSINNQLPGLKVSPYVPDVRIDSLSKTNSEDKGRNSYIKQTNNIYKRDNKIIYRLPTPSDILRSKNINVPKLKKIDRYDAKSRHVKNENTITSKNIGLKNKTISSKTNSSSSSLSTLTVSEAETNTRITESVTNIPYQVSDNINDEINVAWEKFKGSESWRDKMENMISKQVALDCPKKNLHDNSTLNISNRSLNHTHLDDSIENFEELIETNQNLAGDSISMESSSSASEKYESDTSSETIQPIKSGVNLKIKSKIEFRADKHETVKANNKIYINSLEPLEEFNESNESLETTTKYESPIEECEVDKSSNETFVVSSSPIDGRSTSISSFTKTASLVDNDNVENYNSFTDYSQKVSTSLENVPEDNSDMYFILRSPRPDDVDSTNHSSHQKYFLDVIFEDSDTNFQPNLDIESSNLEYENGAKHDLLQSYGDITSQHCRKDDKTYRNEMLCNIEDKSDFYEIDDETKSNNICCNINAFNNQRELTESMQNNFLDIADEIKEIYENIDMDGYKFYPWTFFDNLEHSCMIITTYDVPERSTKNKIIELSDSEDETEIEKSNCTKVTAGIHSLSIIHEEELDQYKVIFPGNSPVYTIFGCSDSLLLCFPLLLTMNISLHEMSTVCNFSRGYRRKKSKKNITGTNSLGKKITLLPLRKCNHNLSKNLQSKTDSSNKHLEGNLANFFGASDTQINEESKNCAINFKSSIELSYYPNSNIQINTEDDKLDSPNAADTEESAGNYNPYCNSFDSNIDNVDVETENLEKNVNSHTICIMNNDVEEHSSSVENLSDDFDSDLSINEFNWDRESKYFASCSSTFSDVDYLSEKSRYHHPYCTNKDNFTVHKTKVEYYETIEYKKDDVDYQTVKTSCVKLPMLKSQYNYNTENKRNWNFPKYSSKWIENTDRFQKKYHRTSKPKALIKLPPLARKKGKQSTSDIDKYDPFASAEQQMMELFSADRERETSNNNNNDKNDNNFNNINNELSITLPEQITPDLLKSTTTPTKSSPPVSAFAVYTRKPTPTESLSPLDNKESDNNNDDDGTVSTSPVPLISKPLDDIEKELLLNNLESCSVVSIDSLDCNKNSSLAGGKYFRSNTDITPRHRTPGDGTSKSNSAGSGRSSNKYKLNMQQMLFGDSPPPPTISSNLNVTIDKCTDISAATVGLLEECEAELMLELEKMLNIQPKTITPPTPAHLPSMQSSFPICSSDDQLDPMEKASGEMRNVGNITIDSAYSSLTRVLTEAGGDTAKTEQSRFCHECGTQYPVAGAKFCCYCGMRRLTI